MYQKLTKIESCSYMYIVPPLRLHMLWLYWGRNDFELFYHPLSGDSYQAGHSLIFSVWSESSLSAWRNLRPLPTHREISRSFSAKSRGENTQWNKWFLLFSFFAQGVFRGETRKKKKSFLLGWSVQLPLTYKVEKWKLALIAVSLQIYWQTFHRNVPWVVLYLPC